MNKELTTGAPTWLPIIEHFVGIVRNLEEVTPKDVQATLKDAKKLVAKMNKLANTDVENENRLNWTFVHAYPIKEKEGEFPSTKATLKADKMESGHIRPFIDWSIEFVEFAAKLRNLAGAEGMLINLADYELELTHKRDRVTHAQQVMADLEVSGIFRESVEHAKKLLGGFEELAHKDDQQAEEYRQDYLQFEKKYFRGLTLSYKKK